jgi:hypothetical protein
MQRGRSELALQRLLRSHATRSIGVSASALTPVPCNAVDRSQCFSADSGPMQRGRSELAASALTPVPCNAVDRSQCFSAYSDPIQRSCSCSVFQCSHSMAHAQRRGGHAPPTAAGGRARFVAARRAPERGACCDPAPLLRRAARQGPAGEARHSTQPALFGSNLPHGMWLAVHKRQVMRDKPRWLK